MPVLSLRRLGVVGLLTATLALPTPAAVASTSTFDTPDQPSAQAPQYLGSAPQARVARSAEVGTAAAPDITKLSFASSATYGPEGAYVEGRAHFTGNVVRAKTEVRVNGVYKGLVEIFQAKDSDKQFVVYKSGWGAGKVVLGPSYITESLDQEPTTASPKDTTKSGEFRVRYGVTRGTFSAVRKGGSMTFKGVGVKMYKIHKEVSAERAEVQVKTSRGWVTKKYLKLAANGNSVSWTIRTGKHYWRLRVPTSTTRLGSNSEVVHL